MALALALGLLLLFEEQALEERLEGDVGGLDVLAAEIFKRDDLQANGVLVCTIEF